MIWIAKEPTLIPLAITPRTSTILLLADKQDVLYISRGQWLYVSEEAAPQRHPQGCPQG